MSILETKFLNTTILTKKRVLINYQEKQNKIITIEENFQNFQNRNF